MTPDVALSPDDLISPKEGGIAIFGRPPRFSEVERAAKQMNSKTATWLGQEPDAALVKLAVGSNPTPETNKYPKNNELSKSLAYQVEGLVRFGLAPYKVGGGLKVASESIRHERQLARLLEHYGESDP